MHTLATGRAWQPLKYTVLQRPYAWDRARGALLLVCDGPARAAWREAQEGWVLPRGRPVPLSPLTSPFVPLTANRLPRCFPVLSRRDRRHHADHQPDPQGRPLLREQVSRQMDSLLRSSEMGKGTAGHAGLSSLVFPPWQWGLPPRSLLFSAPFPSFGGAC